MNNRITRGSIGILQRAIEEINCKVKPFILERDKFEGDLRVIAETLRNCAYVRFNLEYEDEIDECRCEYVSPSDCHVDFNSGVVLVQSDNPRTRHPYDRVDDEYTIVSLLVELENSDG